MPGVVHRSLTELGAGGPQFAGLRTAYQMATLSHARCMVDLQTMVDVLAELPHPWMVVKGPVLVEVGYGDPGRVSTRTSTWWWRPLICPRR